ncbi:MAG: Hsp20/alpha crystallin family protein [Alphaproteobacteria bacterium]|nr:Hsp20/alpha crystallin family protein [Alphaproteobacteria bacterium]
MKNMVSGCSARNHGSELGSPNRSSEINNLMNYFWNYMDMPSTLAETPTEIEPKMQIAETDDAVSVTAELPGIADKDLDLQISSDGYLSICGEKRNVVEQTDKNAYFSEISYGTFKRTIPLPWDLDYEKAKADFQNGVLKVFIPKSPIEKQKFRKIAINSSPSEKNN